MERQYRAPIHEVDSSRPSIGFPLGTALLLIIIFTLSGVFSCCYHWEKLRSFRRFLSNNTNIIEVDIKPKPANMDSVFEKNQSLPVIMPGDKIVKFIALPSPRQSLPLENIIVDLPKQSKPPPMPIATTLQFS